MKIDLKEYFKQRDHQKEVQLQPGPVITISRDFGCRANEVANELLNEITNNPSGQFKNRPWRILNKEIVTEAAKALQRKPYEVEHALKPHEKTLLEEFISSYSMDRLVDKKIQKGIRDLVTSYARIGNLIIVGRAGVAVTRSLDRSLHVKLEAPLAWRVEYLRRSKGISLEKALALVQQNDQCRRVFISHMTNEPYEEAFFDVTFNRATLSTDAIVKSTLQLLESKQLI
ncbi:MAG: AAA family ATPase [Cyclobacteriaceae bacterium]